MEKGNKIGATNFCVQQRVSFAKTNLVKTIRIARSNRTLFFLTFSFAVFVLTSCSHKVVFQSSSVVPAATGTVKMKHDKNENYTLKIRVNGLVDPERLIPSKKFYIVWMESEYNGVKNLGQLRSSSGLFSKKLKAELDAVTPFRPRSVFITSEYETAIQYPGPDIVLRSNNF
jgi:hypothetical protein